MTLCTRSYGKCRHCRKKLTRPPFTVALRLYCNAKCAWDDASNLKKVRPKRSLNKQSRKRKAEAPERKALNDFCKARAGNLCQLRLHPQCLRVGYAAHEILPRAQGGDYLDPKQCLWACNVCNEYAHSDGRKEAIERCVLIEKSQDWIVRDGFSLYDRAWKWRWDNEGINITVDEGGMG